MRQAGKRAQKRGGGRPREEDRERHHEAILDAATAVFLEHGYARASMTDIAARAGASKATIYTRFPSKSTLFAALMERRFRKMQTRIALEADQPTAPPVEVLCRLGVGVLHAVTSEEHRRLHRLILAESDLFPELTAVFWQNGPGRGREVLKQYLGTLVERGMLVIENLDYAAEQLVGTLFGGPALRFSYRLPLVFKNDEELQRWVRSGVEMFLRAHAPAPSPARRTRKRK